MPKIMEIIEKETKGKSYHTYKYSYDSIGVPSIDYDDDPNKIMKWKDSGETEVLKKTARPKTTCRSAAPNWRRTIVEVFSRWFKARFQG